MFAAPSDRPGAPSADPETLQEGEDPGSLSVDDAVHWVKVYGELLTVKSSLLEPAVQLVPPLADGITTEADTDQLLLRAEAERLRRRLDCWTQRAKQLAEAGRAEAPAAGEPV